jgi:hypothetical protein
MEATRFRFGAIVEWAVAAAAIVAVVALGSFTEREVRTVNAVTPVIAREAATPLSAPPAAIPPGSVSIPMLVFSDGKEIHVGDTVSDVRQRLGRNAETAPASTERAPNGERVTATYEHSGIRFRLVLEPFDKGAEPRVAGIYR